MKQISLRFYFISSLIAGLIVVTVISTLLWRASNRMSEIATFMQNGVESVSLAQTVRASLDGHRRQSLMQELEPIGERETTRKTEEARIENFVHELGSLATSHRELRAVDATLHEIENYLSRSRAERQRGLRGVELWTATTADFDRAIGELQRLIDINVEQTIAMEREAIGEGSALRTLLVLSFFAIAFSVAALFWLFRRSVYTPLMNMRRAIADYAATSRVPETKKAGLREIAEISHAFRDLGERLNRQNEQRVLFMSAVAHDLKNPLGAIEMSLELLSSDDQSSPEERRELSDIMHRQMTQLRSLVDDILDGARVQAGRLELRPTTRDLRELVKDSSRVFSSLSTKHRVQTIVPETPVDVSLDPQRFGQVLGNLLSNAIKYSPEGGTVTVRLDADEIEARVSVTDQGLGIEPGELEQIFQPFRRAESTRERIPGVGLGLATAKKIVEAHRGRLEVASQLGVGTTFTVCIPRAAGTSAMATQPRATRPFAPGSELSSSL